MTATAPGIDVDDAAMKGTQRPHMVGFHGADGIDSPPVNLTSYQPDFAL
jgi:hypothetical protein